MTPMSLFLNSALSRTLRWVATWDGTVPFAGLQGATEVHKLHKNSTNSQEKKTIEIGLHTSRTEEMVKC
jgi:hypothetical protein